MIQLHHSLYWEHLGIAGGLAISTFVLLGLGLRLRATPAPRMHIWAMVGFFALNFLDHLDSLAYSDVIATPNLLYGWYDVLLPGFVVALYLYVRALTSAKPQLRPRDLVHLLPFALALLCLAPQLILPGDMRRVLSGSDLPASHLQLIALGETAFWALWVVFLILYGGLSSRRLILHKRNVRAVFSDLEGKTLRWLDWLVATILVLALIVIVDEIRMLMGLSSIRTGVFSLVYDLGLPMAFGLFALRAMPVLPEWSEAVLPAPAAPPAPEPASLDTPPPAAAAQRYARSGLQPADLDRLAARLEKRMADGQLWRDHGLNLRGLAAEIAVPSIHLSELLNTRLGMSFYDYVNQCRIKDACDLLIQSDATILEISETVGFNAKSTFNTSFKKITDQTPSQWRTRHQP